VAANAETRGISLFARVTPSPTLGGFARYDRWQPNRRFVVPGGGSPSADLIIAGLDWQPYKDVHVMPNVERAQGTALAHEDTQARITFHYKFSKP
jgi:hypothetical protein